DPRRSALAPRVEVDRRPQLADVGGPEKLELGAKLLRERLVGSVLAAAVAVPRVRHGVLRNRLRERSCRLRRNRLVRDAAGDDGSQLAERRRVIERIAVDDEQVGAETLLDEPDLVLEAEPNRTVPTRDAEQVEWRDARLAV